MSQRILVATDFSETADLAWRWAVDLARRLDAELCLVHVAMPMATEAPSNCHQDYDRDFSLAQQRLDERAAVAVPASRVKTILCRGETADVLAGLVPDEHIALVVVGMHHHHGAGDIVVGSVAERLVRLAPCTVVVVKPPKAPADAAS